MVSVIVVDFKRTEGCALGNSSHNDALLWCFNSLNIFCRHSGLFCCRLEINQPALSFLKVEQQQQPWRAAAVEPTLSDTNYSPSSLLSQNLPTPSSTPPPPRNPIMCSNDLSVSIGVVVMPTSCHGLAPGLSANGNPPWWLACRDLVRWHCPARGRHTQGGWGGWGVRGEGGDGRETSGRMEDLEVM